MKKQLGLFLTGAVAVWGGAFVLAWLLWSDYRESLLPCSLTAMILCLVPTVLTFLWSSWGLKNNPHQQLLATLGGTGVRMFFVLGVGLLLSMAVGFFRENQLQFWLWILVFYLSTLALEMALILRAQAHMAKPNGTGSPTSLTS